MNFVKIGIMSMLYFVFSMSLFAVNEQEIIDISENYIDASSWLKSPGSIIGVVSGDKLILSRSFGYSNLEDEVVPNTNTIFRIGSLSKTFTGLGLAILKEKGNLRYDDYIEDHIPLLSNISYPYATSLRVTIKHLFTHSSGIACMANLPENSTGKSLVNWLSASALSFSPGDRYLYSNLGIAVLGSVIEKAANKGFEQFITEEILNPLELTNTKFHEEDINTEIRSYGYTNTDGSYQRVNDPNLVGYAPAGAMYSNLEELVKYMSFQFQANKDDANLPIAISPQTLREMHNIQYITDHTWTEGIGVTWSIERNGHLNTVTIGHFGVIEGYTSYFMFDKKREIGVIILANSIEAEVAVLGDELLESIQRLFITEEVQKITTISNRLLEALNNFSDYPYEELFHPSFLTRVPASYLAFLFEQIIKDHGSAVAFLNPYSEGENSGGGIVDFQDSTSHRVTMRLSEESPQRLLELFIYNN